MGLKILNISNTHAEGVLDGDLPCTFAIEGRDFRAMIGSDGHFTESLECLGKGQMPTRSDMRTAIYSTIARYRNAMRFAPAQLA